MDLKRAWRNGFLVSLIFALPLSDLYSYEQRNPFASGSSRNKPARQVANCSAGTDCNGFRNGESSVSGKLNGENAVDGNGLPIPAETSISMSLEANSAESGNISDASPHFSPEEILESVDLTGEDNRYPAGDIQQIVDINTGIGSIASTPFGYGDSTFFAPGHSGVYAPAMFGGGGNAGSVAGFQSGLEDITEEPFTDQLPETLTQDEMTIPNDALHTVPEPSSLMLMSIGIISVASLLHLRKSK